MKLTRRDFLREGVLALLALVTRDVPKLNPKNQVFQFDIPMIQFSPALAPYTHHVQEEDGGVYEIEEIAVGRWSRIGPDDETILGRWETPKSTSMLVHYIGDEDLDA